MTTIKDINIPLNRVEGDLEILVDIKDGVVTEAQSIGTMFRGFEELMHGRGALDGLVITPRICGICSLTHLNAAVEALDSISGVEVPDNGRRLRNVALMAETIQNDLRHSSLMFMVDFAQKDAYAAAPFFEEALKRYDPLKGHVTHEVIKESKKLPQIIAIIGGQWPHTSFMIPGGVVSMPDATRLLQCKMITQQIRAWYEHHVLGCSLERWQRITSMDELERWLNESEKHQKSEVGFLINCLRQAGIAELGVGSNNFISYGNYTLPKDTAVEGHDGRLYRAGFAEKTKVTPFDQELIREDLSHTWFERSPPSQHPANGETIPEGTIVTGRNAYSWVKAPRYQSKVAETGPLAEMLINGNPLFQDMVSQKGATVLARQLARLSRPAALIPAMSLWLEELARHATDPFYTRVETIPDGQGAGLIHAARGALGHWVSVADGRIARYQIITPTAWNGSPKDGTDRHGAWEQALIGTPINDPDNPIEAGHVIRSFDPCMVCAVHTLKKSPSPVDTTCIR